MRHQNGLLLRGLCAGWAEINFSGVTDSIHLVDIIKQVDFVEDTDAVDKLGQPMALLTTSQDWEIVEFYYLPIFDPVPFLEW